MRLRQAGGWGIWFGFVPAFWRLASIEPKSTRVSVGGGAAGSGFGKSAAGAFSVAWRDWESMPF